MGASCDSARSLVLDSPLPRGLRRRADRHPSPGVPGVCPSSSWARAAFWWHRPGDMAGTSQASRNDAFTWVGFSQQKFDLPSSPRNGGADPTQLKDLSAPHEDNLMPWGAETLFGYETRKRRPHRRVQRGAKGVEISLKRDMGRWGIRHSSICRSTTPKTWSPRHPACQEALLQRRWRHDVVAEDAQDRTRPAGRFECRYGIERSRSDQMAEDYHLLETARTQVLRLEEPAALRELCWQRPVSSTPTAHHPRPDRRSWRQRRSW